MTIQEAAQWLADRDNFLILTHRSPDGDTVGSGVGLCYALRDLGKQAYLHKNEDSSQIFLPFLEGMDCPDFIPDHIVAVDIATEDLFLESAQGYKGKVGLTLDHHPSQTCFAQHTCVHPELGAAGELIYLVFSQWNIPLTQEIALPLYLAVSTDTGCFCYGNTTAHTHRVAAALMDTGIQIRDLNRLHFQTKSHRRLKLESMMAQSMKVFDQGTCAIACLTQEMIAQIQATENDTENISNFVGGIEGVVTGITIREKKGGLCKLSMRTDPKVINASHVCALLGGGGHAAASGATVQGTVEDAIQAILDAMTKIQGKAPVPVL